MGIKTTNLAKMDTRIKMVMKKPKKMEPKTEPTNLKKLPGMDGERPSRLY
jgi:hypothetical protein